MPHSSAWPGARSPEPRTLSRPTSCALGLGAAGRASCGSAFDTAVARFNHANAGTDATTVADAYAEVSAAALALAEAVAAEDRAAARRARRSAGAA